MNLVSKIVLNEKYMYFLLSLLTSDSFQLAKVYTAIKNEI